MPPPLNTGGRPNPPFPDRQIANSNATASTFLGGRQQPQWITGGASKPASRPTPRPPVAQVAQQQQQQQQQFSHSVLPSPAPSDEPSPAVSNTHDSPNPNNATLPDLQPAQPAQPAPMVPITHAPIHPTSDARFVRDPTADIAVQPTHEAVLQNQASFLANSQLVRSPVTVASPRAPMTPVVTTPLASPAIIQAGTFGNPILVPGQGQATNPYPPQPGPSAGPPAHKRRRITPAGVPGPSSQPPIAMLSYASFFPQTNEFLSRWGLDNLKAEIDVPRIRLLQEACTKEDGFFLALHQLYCIWSEHPGDVHRVFHQLDQPTINTAFAFIEPILKKNNMLSAATRQWFPVFPARLSQLLETSNAHRTAIQQVSGFLQKLAQSYNDLTRRVTERGYPYTVDELLGYLHCFSPVLQKILFTACRRKLGVRDSDLSNKMDQYFHDDQRAHLDPATNSLVFAPNQQSHERTARLVKKYQYLMAVNRKQTEQPAQQSNGQSPSLGSLRAPSTHPPATQLQNPILARPATGVPGFQTGQPFVPTQVAPLHTTSPFQDQPQGLMVPPGMVLASNVGQEGHFAMNQQTQQNGYMQYGVAPAQHSNGAQQQLQGNPFAQQSQLQQQRIHQQMLLDQNMERQIRTLQQQQQQPTPQLIHQSAVGQQHLQQNQQRLGQLVWQAQQSPPQQQYGSARLAPVPPARPPTRQLSVGSVSQVRATLPSVSPRIQQMQPPRQRSRQLEEIASRPLLPPRGAIIQRQNWPHSEHDKAAIMAALHQADVRSPKRVVPSENPERFYQAIKALAAGPAHIPPKDAIQRITFDITPQQYALMTRVVTRPFDLLKTAEHLRGCLRWRLRCCKVTPDKARNLTEQLWVLCDMNWPDSIAITLNGKHLKIKRESSNGKDLPIELTDLVTCGVNTLQITLPDIKNNDTKHRYVAVEVVETLSHSEVLNLVWDKGVIPQDVTLKKIRDQLTGPASNDDGLEVLTKFFTIDLACPFSSTIFQIPARGVDCGHMECFDLITWLETRPSKPKVECIHLDEDCACKHEREPSLVDKWKCPICLADARPYSLRIDQFLHKVRGQLEEQGKLHAKKLNVEKDGSWSVIVEADEDVDSDDDIQPRAASRAAPTPAVPRKEVEVIEIDSD
ncbi:hypothetical protein OQA88_13532 [Cercophora sp. LCS_1]